MDEARIEKIRQIVKESMRELIKEAEPILRADERRRLRDGAVIERLAAYAHEAWAGWMHYQKEKAPEAWAALPEWARTRWEWQMTTPYESLPEEDKPSDRLEAQRIVDAILGKE